MESNGLISGGWSRDLKIDVGCWWSRRWFLLAGTGLESLLGSHSGTLQFGFTIISYANKYTSGLLWCFLVHVLGVSEQKRPARSQQNLKFMYDKFLRASKRMKNILPQKTLKGHGCFGTWRICTVAAFYRNHLLFLEKPGMINPIWQGKGFQWSVRVGLEPVTVCVSDGQPAMEFVRNKSSTEWGCSALLHSSWRSTGLAGKHF